LLFTPSHPIESSAATADQSKSPRGVSGFQLNDGNFTIWKVQGKLGGYIEYVLWYPKSASDINDFLDLTAIPTRLVAF
jgi:hypothetical protein